MKKYYRAIAVIFLIMAFSYMLMSYSSIKENKETKSPITGYSVSDYRATATENSHDKHTEAEPIQDVVKRLEKIGFERVKANVTIEK